MRLLESFLARGMAFFAMGAFFLVLASVAGAQTTCNAPGPAPHANPELSGGTRPSKLIRFGQNLDASLTSMVEHDSSNGWSSIQTPCVSYRIDRHFNLDASVAIYTYINVDETHGTFAAPFYVLASHTGAPGDTVLALQFSAAPNAFDLTTTASLGLPSGESSYGLGAGRPTYDFNNQAQKSFGIVAPDIEVGLGDSNRLVSERVHKSYTTVGPLAHFQAGSSIQLPYQISFESDAYEELPLSSATLYSSTRRGKKKVTTTKNASLAEDNGFISTLYVPLNSHLLLSGVYNRSLRGATDIVEMSITFLLKAPLKR
ncbi:MAG: hypothetical protein ACYCSN_15855 [Acidobacteriaceae bacterium]